MNHHCINTHIHLLTISELLDQQQVPQHLYRMLEHFLQWLSTLGQEHLLPLMEVEDWVHCLIHNRPLNPE